MIERSRLPGRSGVANLAGLRKSRLHVIRVSGALEVFQVTRNAGRTGQVVIVIDVAISALPRRHRVCSGQREIHQRVVERRRLPGHRGVALLASLGKVGRDVVRIRSSLEILQVARYAGGAGQVVVIVDVAIHALPGRHGMPSGQGKAH